MKSYLIDLDGTVYKGKELIKGVDKKIEEIRKKGHQIIFLTNNSTKSREDIVKELKEMGVECKKEEICSAGYVLTMFLKKERPEKKVYFIGEKSLQEQMKKEGIKLGRKGNIIAVGLDEKFNYKKLSHALTLSLDGAEIIAGNSDATYPTEKGIMPGAGAIVAALEKACGKKALVVGKPYEYTYKILKEMARGEELILIGDRLDTDVAFAHRYGIKPILVLSGITKKEDVKNVKDLEIIESLAQLKI